MVAIAHCPANEKNAANQRKKKIMTAKKKIYIIEDWAGNICFQGKEFKSSEDAWEFIQANEPEESWQEYEVVEKK